MSNSSVDTDVLARSPLFSEIGQSDLETVARVMRKKTLNKGDHLFRAGEEGDAMAVLFSGELTVQTTDRDTYVVEESEVVGEMMCVDPETRSADVVATEPSEVGLLDRKSLLLLRESSPGAYAKILRSIALRLTRRLQWVNEQVHARYAADSAIRDIPRASSLESRAKAFEEKIDFREIDALRDFDASELEVLAKHVRCRRYPEGSVLCREGAEADRCFIVVDGEVEIRKDVTGHTVVLGATEKGALLGQSALICDTRRTATLQARTPVVTVELERDVFEKLLNQKTPMAVRFKELIAKTAVRQLRDANARLGQIPSFRDIRAEEESANEPDNPFQREDTVKRFYDQVLRDTGISERELESISFA